MPTILEEVFLMPSAELRGRDPRRAGLPFGAYDRDLPTTLVVRLRISLTESCSSALLPNKVPRSAIAISGSLPTISFTETKLEFALRSLI